MAFKERKETKYIAVHCSATKPSQDFQARDIKRMHLQRGFLDIGYHFIITRSGEVQKGRPENVIGAHVEGFNSVSVGVCLIGGVKESDGVTGENNFTEAQFKALRGVLKSLKEIYPAAVIQGHRDFPNVAKECPCFDVKSWLEE
ncbi:N-acetylmuramoyl-L-alanine amidase [Chromobacterium haemolyticum]|uniref:N-acetylmuramoyl-L-alanine amidase n=1 Tax=Chromobacterium TaxID=535 RepID=UPI004056BD91